MENKEDNMYYSIVIVSGNKILYRIRKLFCSVAQAKSYLKEAMLDKNMIRIQKVKIEVI